MEMPTAMVRFPSAFLKVLASLVPKPNPMPMMGPIKGLINIAPMTTAAELTLSPMEQMMMLNTKIHRLNPRNSMSFLMPTMVCSASARSMMRNRSMASGRSNAERLCRNPPPFCSEEEFFAEDWGPDELLGSAPGGDVSDVDISYCDSK